MSEVFGYIRVSDKTQKLHRQLDEMLDLGIPKDNIYHDEQSGKDFDRVGYQYMKRALKPGYTLVIKSLDRLGRNQKEVKAEWEWFKDKKINIRVLDMPILNREYKEENDAERSVNELIRNVVFEVISWTDEEHRRRIKTSQKEGIAAAKRRGKHLGRPRLNYETLPEEKKNVLKANYDIWKSGEITAVSLMDKLGLKKNSFYKIVKEYEERKTNGTL